MEIYKRDIVRKPTVDREGLKMTRKEEHLFPGTELLIDHWNSLNMRPCKKGTKGYEDSYNKLNKLRAGTLFNQSPHFQQYKGKRFLKEDVLAVFEKASLAAHDPSYHPINKDFLLKIYLNQFLFNPFVPNERAKSPFLLWHETELKKVVSDTKPEITNRLIARYRYDILCKPDWQPNYAQREKFVMATNRVWDFMVKYQVIKKLPYAVKRETIADWLFEAVQRCNFSQVAPGSYCSDYVISTALPAFLVNQGILGVETFKGQHIFGGR